MNEFSGQGVTTRSLLSGVDASSTVAAVRAALEHPSENSSLLLIVVACVVLAVVMLAVFAIMLLTPATKKVVKKRTYYGVKPDGAIDESAPRVVTMAPARKPSRLFMAITGPLALSLLIAFGLIATYLGTSTDLYCAQTCHAGSGASKTAEATEHARCVECHESGPVLGVVSRTRMAVEYSLGANPASGTVDSDSRACLRCHDKIRSGTTLSAAGIKMSHKEVISAGQPCSQCHTFAGHTKSAYSGTMSECLPCHNAKIASAECDTCHAKNPSSIALVPASSRKALGSGNFVYPAVRAANRKCGGCHDQSKSCDPCHVIRMPHSQDFIEGGHARPAAFRAKLSCWRCHDPQFCGNSGCHIAAFDPKTGNTTHGPQWTDGHKIDDWNAGCGCHMGRSPRKAPICTRCHDPKTHKLLPIKQ